MSATHYELSVDSWVTTDRVTIRSSVNDTIGLFPLPFLRAGGDNTWSYIERVVSELLDIEEGCTWGIEDTEGRHMTGNAAPVAGVYRVTTQGVLPQSIRILIPVPSFRTMLLMLIAVDANIAVRWSTGPEYFRRGQAPKPEGSFSTRSDSKRSSVNQVGKLKLEIAGAYYCLTIIVSISNCGHCEGRNLPSYRCRLR